MKPRHVSEHPAILRALRIVHSLPGIVLSPMPSPESPVPSSQCNSRGTSPAAHARSRGWGLFTALVALFCLSAFSRTQAAEPIQLKNITKDSGINFIHTDGSSGKRYIIETICAGLALFDYDGDGDEDIYFLNGAALPGKQVSAPPKNALYRNDGNLKFTDVTEATGTGNTEHGLGVAVGDYDNDGDPDIYLNNYGPNTLLQNQGNGTFTDVTTKAGVANGHQVGAGACFFDMDADGDLDLYAANYVKFTYQNHKTVRFNGHPAYVGPMDFKPSSDTLYRNNGDGTFTDVSVPSGIAAHEGTGMGMTCCDYDNDGDVDVFVGNDVSANFVFQNDGQGRFEEVGLLSGLAYNFGGTAQGTMGVDAGDFNNDGLIDFYVTSYQRDLATLYKNLGEGLFEDVTHLSGAGSGTLPQVTWGTAVVDLDNDGFRDLFIACGHLQDNVELFDNTSSYHAKNIVLRNLGNEKFRNVSSQCGDGLLPELSSRGAAFGDLDNDGDLDGVILNSRREPTILRNDSKTGNHWIQIKLRGQKGNRSGIGAHVKVKAGPLTMIDEVHGDRSYQSHFGLRLHFGLGKQTRIDQIEVRWIGGTVDVLKDIPVDQLITVREGSATEQE
jgi:hypothetical protein